MSKQDIEGREREWLQAFNSGDASGVANVYTQDARLMPPNSGTVQGRGAIEGFIKEFLASKAQLSFKLLAVHESEDLCAAIGEFDMAIPGAPNDNGKFIEVWRRQPDGAWLMADDIFNSSLPAPAG